ncbi:uncharacterized protein LOC108233214 [Kryptolebias marmoratus]|uniref:uncharacterized protein LOC108233214 n=1 Tax=Kryptolebias marmoratus TaxID=37003 RepID=UPI0018AD0340|nr:uncharacterized protein LOC108233214 [Kryptolebias marmoratus]
MLTVNKLMLMFFIVSGLSDVLHPMSTGPTLTKGEEEQSSQINPEEQLAEHEISTNRNKEGNLNRNHEYAEKTDEAFSTRTVLQNTPNEKSSPFDTVDKKVVKSKKMNPIERLRQEIVEEEQKDKLISGNHLHEARENTKKDEKLVAKEEITKKDIKHTSFDQPEIPATIQAVTPLPFLYQSVLPSSPDASVKVSAHSKVKLSDVKVKPGLIAEDGAVRSVLVKPAGAQIQTHTAEPTRKTYMTDEAIKDEFSSTLQAAKAKPPRERLIFRDLTTKETNSAQKSNKNQVRAKIVHLTQEPNSTETQGEPGTIKQMENGTIYTKILTKTSQQRQVTKTSGKPRLTSATTPSTKPTKPTKTNNRRKNKKRRKGKKKTSPPTYFPYFKDDYCPSECACYGRVVQCSDKAVSHVPYGIPYNARYILLMNNHITSIQLDLLSEYESMEFLTLSNNWLTDGAIEGAFEGVPALKRLYLDRNLLQSVPVDLPHSLEELRLDNNRLRLMSEAAWTRCPGLLVLSLSNNSLGNRSESLPDGALSPLCKLRTLNLDYNLLASVPLGLPPSIKELYLRGNHIRQFCRGVFNGLSELVVLDLSSNRLTNRGLFEDSLLNAKHLESLNLEGNKLRQVPQHLPTSLKTLNLEGNLIFSIKKATFSTLKNLEHLGLARNKIFKVAPGAFKMLPILHQLDLCHNTLQQVPRQLPQGLHSVALTHNKIKAVPRDAFCWGNKSLSGLVRVQLEHNLINMGKLDSQAFRCLRGFQVVSFY